MIKSWKWQKLENHTTFDEDIHDIFHRKWPRQSFTVDNTIDKLKQMIGKAFFTNVDNIAEAKFCHFWNIGQGFFLA